ncbi:MAG: ATP-binding protein [Candidatus Methanomethylophilaceae archaeon]|nr:ATP-binding protein [Candidatus Methanomethylophilaceae archaeon]
MLLCFKVANFMSFKNLQEFSMVAGNDTDHADHLIHGIVNIVDRAAIFGPNSSGKSNFVNAMAYAQKIVRMRKGDLFSSEEKRSPIKSFESMNYHGDGNSKSESYFEFQLLLNDKVYSYGFEYNTILNTFVSEWLSELFQDGTERTIFKRDYDEDGEIRHTEADKKRDVHSDSEEYIVESWITTSLQVVSTFGIDSEYHSVECSISHKRLLFLLKQLLRLDTGIDGMLAASDENNKVLDYWFRGITHLYEGHRSSDAIWSDDSSIGHAYDDEIYHRISYDGKHLSIGFENERVGLNVCFTHYPSHFSIPIEDESEGTKKIIHILLLLLGECEYKLRKD